MSGAGAGAVAGRWSRGRADFSHMWTPREVQLCSRIRRCCCCCCCGLCPGLGTASSCIIQQNSEWLFFMGLFISFDHLFQVALSLCLPLTISFSSSSFLFFSLFLYSFQLLALEMIPSRRWRKNHHQMLQPCPGASQAEARRHLPCAAAAMCVVYWTKNFGHSTNHTWLPRPPASHPRQPLPLLSADRNQSASLCGKWQRIIWFYFMCSKWPTENK